MPRRENGHGNYYNKNSKGATQLCLYFYEARDVCPVSTKSLMEKNQGKDSKQQT